MREAGEVQAAGVDRHSQRGVHVHRLKRTHVVVGGDAAGGRDLGELWLRAGAGTSRDRCPASCLLYRHKCRENRRNTAPARRMTSSAVRVERLPPALHDDAAVLRIQREQDAVLRPTASRVRGENASFRPVGGERGRADDHLRAPMSTRRAAFSGVRTPPPTRVRALRGDALDQILVGARCRSRHPDRSPESPERRRTSAASRPAIRLRAPSRAPARAGRPCRPSGRCTGMIIATASARECRRLSRYAFNSSTV